MKAFWIFRIIFVVSSLAFAPVSFPAHAQSPGHTMSVNVPFGFELGNQALRARCLHHQHSPRGRDRTQEQLQPRS